MQAIQSLFDHFSYVSYRTQRDAGASAEWCAKHYANAADLERQYQLAKQLQNQRN